MKLVNLSWIKWPHPPLNIPARSRMLELPISQSTPILCSCDVLPAGYKTPPETEVVAQLLHTLPWVMLLSQLKLLRVLPGLVCLPFEFRFFFSCFPCSLPAPCTAPRLPVSPPAVLPGSLPRSTVFSPHGFSRYPGSHLGSRLFAAPQADPLRQLYSPYPPVPYPSPELPTKFDGPLRVFWNYYFFFIKRLRA